MEIYEASELTQCRHALLSTCDEVYTPDASPQPPALALYQIKVGDKLDFGIDFSMWIKANGGTLLTAVTWSAATGLFASPQTPTIASSAFLPTGLSSATLDAANAAPGDTYYLECVATFAVVAATTTEIGVPARTLRRRLHIIVTR